MVYVSRCTWDINRDKEEHSEEESLYKQETRPYGAWSTEKKETYQAAFDLRKVACYAAAGRALQLKNVM